MTCTVLNSIVLKPAVWTLAVKSEVETKDFSTFEDFGGFPLGVFPLAVHELQWRK